MRTVDAHLHLIQPERFRYPWLAAAPALVAGNTDVAHEPIAARAGIHASVFVEVDVDPADAEREAEFAGTLAEQPNAGVVAFVAAARPEHDGFDAYMERIRHPRLVGVRRVLHVVPDDVSRAPRFRRNAASLADRNLTFDLCVRADQLTRARELAQAASRTRLVLDHAGNPPLADAAALAAWHDDVARLAEAPNVVCKVSGLVNHVPPTMDPFAALAPVVAHLVRCFGWERLMFGSDWPVCKLAGFDLPDWATLARRLVADATPEEHDAFFCGTAARVYGLEIADAV